MGNRERRLGAGLFAVSLVVYGLTSYGGVRSPDSEVVFRTCEALAFEGSWAVEPLELDPGFGVAPGWGGANYSVFGPLESLVCVPILGLWRATGLAPHTVPPSHYVDGGYRLMLDRRPAGGEAHRARFFVSFLNSILGAATVLVFFLLVLPVSRSPDLAAVIAAIFAIGSLNWWYATTFFSEPLALVLALGSFAILNRPESGSASVSKWPVGLSTAFAGVLSGLSVTAHLSAVLFLPLFAVAAVPGVVSRPGSERRWRAVFAFAVGTTLPLALLALYNVYRFGSPLETGRGVVADAAVRFGYGEWVAPWEGLVGLLVSPGKGLLFFCPLVLLGLFALPALHRRRRPLFWIVVGVVVTRVLVVAARSDWHGGFGLGPRYLVLIIPWLLLPVACWVSEDRSGRRTAMLLVAGVLAAGQQLYFVLGEVFFYYHSIWLFAERTGRSEILADIYFRWEFSPLIGLHRGAVAPWVLRGSEISVWLILAGFIAVVAGVAAVVSRQLCDRARGR